MTKGVFAMRFSFMFGSSQNWFDGAGSRGRGCPEQDVRRTVQDVGILGLRGDEYKHIAEGEQGLQVGDVRADNLHGNEDAAR